MLQFSSIEAMLTSQNAAHSDKSVFLLPESEARIQSFEARPVRPVVVEVLGNASDPSTSCICIREDQREDVCYQDLSGHFS
jgi:hypothetical protein